MNDSQKYSLENFEYSIKTVGFYKIEGCIKNQELINSLVTDVDIAFEKDKKNIKSYDTYRFYDIIHQLLGRGDSFLELMLNSKINECAEKILSPTCIIHSYNAVKLMPSRGNNATNIHRDNPRFYRQDYPLSLQALVCLDSFTLENGATYLLPGSHHVPEKPTDEYFYNNSQRVIANPGDVVFFDSLIWHAGGENKTEKPRRGITIVYTRSFMKQQIDLAKALTAEYIASMPLLGKKLIGMDVRVPTSLEEFYLPEEDRLYKPNQG